ncbi:MAG: DUF2508 family protein [Clostridiales bacterium]|nr:DUF2508 family protein [Clostridiales bacterium]
MKNYLLAFFSGKKDAEEPPDKDWDLMESVQAAQQEWQDAQAFFENVCEPELVDYAIFKMETAKRKYMYLLNLAKKEGLQNKQFLMESNEAAQS